MDSVTIYIKTEKKEREAEVNAERASEQENEKSH